MSSKKNLKMKSEYLLVSDRAKFFLHEDLFLNQFLNRNVKSESNKLSEKKQLILFAGHSHQALQFS